MTEISRQTILALLYESIDEVNEQLAQEEWLQKSPDLVLIGNVASMDSLAFVNFIALVEEKCEDRFGAALTLTDASTSFTTLGELADLICTTLSQRDMLNTP
jgi:acyl carrier protein